MAAERGAIRHHDLVAEIAVVSDVRIRHQQIVVADAGHPLVVGGAAIHRDGFAKYVAVADFEARRLALVFLVLRRVAQGSELKYLIVSADPRRTVDHRVRSDPGAGADDHVRTDDREWTDLHVRRDLSLRRDDPARIDHPASPLVFSPWAFEPFVSGAPMISAAAPSTPSPPAEP